MAKENLVPMKRVQHYIPQAAWEELKELSEKSGLGASEHMRRALAIYLALDASQAMLGTLNIVQAQPADQPSRTTAAVIKNQMEFDF